MVSAGFLSGACARESNKSTTFSLTKCFRFHLISDTSAIPMVDLGFAISATAAKSKENFIKMKDVIKRIIFKYGSHRMAYSVLTFGSTPTIRVRFSDSISGEALLSWDVDNIPQNPGTASLDKALDGARDLFKISNGARPNASNILVVITDKKSDSMAQAVEKSAEVLDDMGIRVIGVALGNEFSGELDDVTDVSGDVINTTDSVSPAKIVEKVMERILDSKCFSQ